MTDEAGAQSGLVVEVGFEWKNAQHEVQPARHLRDPPAIPGPDLRANVVDSFAWSPFSVERPDEAQIEAGKVDQHDRIGSRLVNLAERFTKLFPKIPIVFNDFPQTNHGRMVDPVVKLFALDCFHLRAAAS